MTSRTSIATDRRRAAGFTLVELLVVCGLLAVVLGLSVGALARVGQSTAVRGGERILRAALTRARRSAMEQGTLSRVLVDPGDGERPVTVTLAVADEVVTLHFEAAEANGLLMGRNQYARLSGGELVDGGTLGRCVQLSGGAVSCGRDAGLDPSSGFLLEMDVFPDELEGQAFAFGDGIVLELAPDGSLTASIEFADQERVTLSTEPDILAKGAWARIGLSVDGLEIRLLAHGVAQAIRPERRLPNRPRREAQLELGRGFSGRLDEVLYRTLDEEPAERLDGTVSLESSVPQVLRFDAQGRLDRRLHDGPVVIALLGEAESVRITINLQGVVR